MFELWRLSHYCFLLGKIRKPVSFFFQKTCNPQKLDNTYVRCAQLSNARLLWRKSQRKVTDAASSNTVSPNTCYCVGSSLSHGTSYGGDSNDIAVSCTTQQQPGTEQHGVSLNIQAPLLSDLWTLQMCFPEDSHSLLMVYSVSASSQPALNSPLHIWCHFHKKKKILTCRCYKCLRQP